jgi:hypothetical protein
VSKINGDLILEQDEVGIILRPLVVVGEVRRTIPREKPGQWPIRHFTSTTDMRDFIADVVSIEGSTCIVDGVYRRRMVRMRNVRVCSPEIRKPGDRVMVTEHVGIDGRFGFMATKKRVLAGDLNFINVGWSDEEESKYLVVDIYTGEAKTVVGRPVFMDIRKRRS